MGRISGESKLPVFYVTQGLNLKLMGNQGAYVVFFLEGGVFEPKNIGFHHFTNKMERQKMFQYAHCPLADASVATRYQHQGDQCSL